jgi:hypothetical protein
VGGDGWSQTGPYEEDLAAAFRRAQERELERDDYGFGGRAIDELWADEEWQEFVLTGGTGTVLDQWRLIDAGADDDVAMMRPLTDREIRAWAAGGAPTREEWLDAPASLQRAHPFPGSPRRHSQRRIS